MKDEIKEIFNKYGKEKYNDEYCLEFETYIIELQELKKIYDYITNLQEENENLKDYLKIMEKGKDNNLNRFLDYKSRNEKAIEFIKEKISSTKGVINDYMYHKEHNKILIELLQEDIEMYKKELNILGGGDNE